MGSDSADPGVVSFEAGLLGPLHLAVGTTVIGARGERQRTCFALLLLASVNEGPLSGPVLRRDGAWLREVSPDGMDAGGAPAGRRC